MKQILNLDVYYDNDYEKSLVFEYFNGLCIKVENCENDNNLIIFGLTLEQVNEFNQWFKTVKLQDKILKDIYKAKKALKELNKYIEVPNFSECLASLDYISDNVNNI